jgi:hypothetical protein
LIPVNPNELRQAFWCHVEKRTTTENLLLFYAVECGLKSLYLRRSNLRTTAQITDAALTGRGHDLRLWIKQLRLPAAVDLPQGFRLSRDLTSWELAQVHEAWRYGAVVHAEDEPGLRKGLERIRSWIEEALSR